MVKKRHPLALHNTGKLQELLSGDTLYSANGISLDVGGQSEGGIVQGYDLFTDFISQGFLTQLPPVPPSLTATMLGVSFPGSAFLQHVAYVKGHRVYKTAGDSSLSFTYEASKDTYNDLSYSGTITHVAVNNGAGAPAVTANSLRLEKVVTNGTTVTSVTQLAVIRPAFFGSFTRFESSGQAITAGGSLTIAHGLASTPRKIWYDLINTTAELGYSIGQRIAAQSVTGKNGAGPGLTIVADATNLNIRFNSGSPVFNVVNFTTGASANITNADWNVIFYVEL